MPNKRIFYAVQAVCIAPDGYGDATKVFTTGQAVRGLQSIGITTTFNLEPIFEIGQLSLYENYENVPDIEVTMTKVLDGWQLMYHKATLGALADTLTGRSTQKCNIGFAVYSDNNSSASGTPVSECVMSGMFPQQLTYTFPVDGNCTEAITFVGNNRIWRTSGFAMGSFYLGTDTPVANIFVTGSGHVQRRKDVVFTGYTYTYDPTSTYASGTDVNGMVNTSNATILPPDIPGISASGTNNVGADGQFAAHILGITASVNLGRDQLFELGRRGPFFRYVNFPVEVTTSIEVHSIAGDQISATEEGTQGDGSNVINRTIKIYTLDGTFINLGTRNKIASVTKGGGDATGGNVSDTFNYLNYNDMIVSHPRSASTTG